jgi:O-methyltransferase
MKQFLGKVIFKITRRTLNRLGFHISLPSAAIQFPELSNDDLYFIREVHGSSITFTSFESLATLAICCQYVSEGKIRGDFVEAGVWRGGSSIVAKRMLRGNRDFHLFDTFSGMTEPGWKDKRIGSTDSAAVFRKWKESKSGNASSWDYASLEEVKKNFAKFKELDSSVRFIEGDVRRTLLEENLPTEISILRLDTDFYDSTLIELQVLWPRLVVGGILILDDYGHWDGARAAVDEYFQKYEIKNVLKIPFGGGPGRIVMKT